MRTHYRIKVAGMALVAVAAPLAAHAALDEKSYSPAFCKPSTRDSNTSYEFVDGMLVNNGVEDDFFTCPLVRDNHGASNNLSKVFVEALLDSTNPMWDCTLYTLVEDEPAVDGNGVSEVVDFVYKAGNLPFLGSHHVGPDQVILEDITASDGNEGGYALTCTLGPGAALRNITVREE